MTQKLIKISTIVSIHAMTTDGDRKIRGLLCSERTVSFPIGSHPKILREDDYLTKIC